MFTVSKFAWQSMVKQGFQSVIFFLLVLISSACLYGVGFFTENMQSGAEQAGSHIHADMIAVPSEYGDNAKDALFEGNACTILFRENPTELLSQIDGVSQVSPQLFLRTLPLPCCSASGVQIIAFDTNTDFAVSENLKDKSIKISELSADELIAGAACGLTLGAQVNFYDRTFTVSAVLDETGMGYDQSIFISFEAADLITADEQYQEYFGGKTGLTSMILIRTDDDAEQVRKNMSEILNEKGISVYTIDSMSEKLIRQMQDFKIFALIINLFVILLASVSLSALITVSFHQRRNRVGSLLSVGISRKKIIQMFLLEYLYLTAFGTVTGTGIICMIVLSLHDVIKQSLALPYKFIGMEKMGGLFLTVGGINLLMLLLACSLTFAKIIRTEPAILSEEQT